MVGDPSANVKEEVLAALRVQRTSRDTGRGYSRDTYILYDSRVLYSHTMTTRRYLHTQQGRPP